MQGPVAKKDVALYLLESSLVQFHIDPRKEGVALPEYLRVKPQVALDIGLNTPVPIPDLDVGEEGIRCTLSFNRTPFPCVLPWASIFAMVTRDGKAAVWPEDVPPESPLAKELAQPKPKLTAVPKEEPQPIPLKEKRAEGKRASTVGGKTKSAGAAKARATKEVPPKKRSKESKGTTESPSVTTRPHVVPLGKPAPRPALAVAAPAEPEAPMSESDSAKTGDRSESRQEGPAASPKKKRDLPPYLRIVK